MASQGFFPDDSPSLSTRAQAKFLGPLADLTPLLRNKKVYFEPLFGNHGDKLIEVGSSLFLQRMAVHWVRNPATADIIVINGGAAMTDIWGSGFSTLEI